MDADGRSVRPYWSNTGSHWNDGWQLESEVHALGSFFSLSCSKTKLDTLGQVMNGMLKPFLFVVLCSRGNHHFVGIAQPYIF